MINHFREQSAYLLKLNQKDLGDLVSRRLQGSLPQQNCENQLERLGATENAEDIFALTYDYHYHSRYSARLRKVVGILADAWSQHDPQIIKRNPKPLADLLFLASYINLPATPAIRNIIMNPVFQIIQTQDGETFGDLEERFNKKKD